MPNSHFTKQYNKVVVAGDTIIDLSSDTVEEAALASGYTAHDRNGASITGTALYAAAPVANGNATHTNAILYGNVDSTSTATVFTATVAGLTSLYDGVTVFLHNGVVTSASGFTVNINGLGAKKCYNNMTNATQDTTIFNSAYTMMFVYSSTLDSGNGGWWIYRGYDANTNTIGYQLRTNSSVRNVSDTARYYKLYFTSADDTMWVPASVNSTNNATAARPVNQRPIDPFGPIVYTSASTNFTAGSNLTATAIWQQYVLALGYSFNRTGAALTMTVEAPVYVKCAPQANGSAIMDADTPIVQALPTTNDGKIYIYLGLAYSATNIELQTVHPVYWHDGTALRLWTGAADSGVSDVTVTQTQTSGTEIASISVDGSATKLYAPTPPTAATTNPLMDGTASYGSGTVYARSNHVHPTDTTRQATLVSGTNIKTIASASILGSGDLSLEDLGALSVDSIADSNTTGITIASHSTSSITGVQSSTTTASKVTLGTAISVPNVTGATDVTVPIKNASATTVPIKNASATSIPNVTAAGSGSFTQGSFSGGSLTMAMDATDTKCLNITFTPATHGADSHTHTPPTLGAAISIIGVQSSTTSVTGVQASTTTASKVTLGTAISVPNVTGATDVTVPIKNTSATTVVTSATHTVNDSGHSHSLTGATSAANGVSF